MRATAEQECSRVAYDRRASTDLCFLIHPLLPFTDRRTSLSLPEVGVVAFGWLVAQARSLAKEYCNLRSGNGDERGLAVPER